MIVIAGVLIGAIFGALQARRAKGNRMDTAQYGAAYAIAFGIVALFATLLIDRMI